MLAEPNRAGYMRYSCLQTIRKYGLEQLIRHGGYDDARNRHAAYYLALAELGAVSYAESDQPPMWSELEQEQQNLLEALQWAGTSSDRSTGLRLAVALAPFWMRNGEFAVGWYWIDRVLADADVAPAALHAAVLRAAGKLAASQADFNAWGARTWGAESGPIARLTESGDQTRIRRRSRRRPFTEHRGVNTSATGRVCAGAEAQ